MSGLLLVLLTLGVYRIWRFLAKDDITSFFHAHIPGKLGDGWRCAWCLGTWLSIGATYFVHTWFVKLEPHWGLWAAAVACGVGFLGEIDDRLSG